MAGWIRLHRKIKDNWLWKDAQKLKWFLDVILSANYADNKVLIKGVLLDCKRGQSIKSLETWAREWRTSKATVKRFMDLLEKDKIIVTENVKVTTRITICKYDSYNNPQDDDDTPKRNADETQTKRTHTPNNKGNNNKEEKEKEITYPFLSENFLAAWGEWIEYKKTQHNFTYKSNKSEQQGLNLLFKECRENETFAIEMLNYAMAKGYKGWVPKDDVNFYSGKAQQPFVLTPNLDN